jgi:hypothetical protein
LAVSQERLIGFHFFGNQPAPALVRVDFVTEYLGTAKPMNRAASLGIFIVCVLAPPVAGFLRGVVHGGEGVGLISFFGLIFGGAAIVPIWMLGIIAHLIFRKHARKTWIIAAVYVCSSALACWAIIHFLLD